ncbi:MAG: transporter [Desulfuromonadales bacterium]|nr:transporter [Desulfuromonadales bacterium]
MKKTVISLCLGLTFLWVSTAGAILIDPYDNFLAPDGYYGLLYGNYYTADELVTSDGDFDIDLEAKVSVLRGLKYFHLANIPMALQVIVPFGEVKETKLFNEKSSGLGDVIFGPAVFLHADTETNTYLSYWFYIFAPTGEWDSDQAINMGKNTWYFEHQLAFSKMIGSFVYDMNLNYYHFQEEPDNDYQAPNRFEVEASLAYQVNDRLSLGINGGGYWDRDEAEVDGDSVPGTKAKRVQVGPSINYQFTETLGANLRWTHDTSSANDTKGDDIWLRIAYAF